MFLPVHVAEPLVKAGKLNMLAAGGTRRASATPNVPSLAEKAGVRDIDTDIWYALYAPAQTPREILAEAERRIECAIEERRTRRSASIKQGLQPTGGTPSELEQLTRTDLERWAKVVRDANIQPGLNLSRSPARGRYRTVSAGGPSADDRSAAQLDVFPRRLALVMQVEVVLAQRGEFVRNGQRKALAATAAVDHQVIEQALAARRFEPDLA